MVIESTYLENDEFGYSCYAVALPAPPGLTKELSEIERTAGQKRAKIPAHITVKGTFYEPRSLPEILEIVESIAADHHAISLPTAGHEVYWTDRSAGFRFISTREIQRLHDELVAAIEPVSQSAYADDPFRGHLGIVDTVSPNAVKTAVELGRKVELPKVLELPLLDTYGRDGNAADGEWKRISRIELGNNQ